MARRRRAAPARRGATPPRGCSAGANPAATSAAATSASAAAPSGRFHAPARMTQASAGTASDQSATGSFFKPGLRPAPENQLADHGSRLELLVRLAQIGRVDGRERLLQRAAQLSGVEPVGDLVEQAML